MMKTWATPKLVPATRLVARLRTYPVAGGTNGATLWLNSGELKAGAKLVVRSTGQVIYGPASW